MGFWSNFWGFVKKKIDEYDEEKKIQVKIQPWEDVREYNPLAIANTKLTSLVCDEATVELQTGVACVNTNRRFIGIELDEGYFNIAKKRIEEAYDTATGD